MSIVEDKKQHPSKILYESLACYGIQDEHLSKLNVPAPHENTWYRLELKNVNAFAIYASSQIKHVVILGDSNDCSCLLSDKDVFIPQTGAKPTTVSSNCHGVVVSAATAEIGFELSSKQFDAQLETIRESYAEWMERGDTKAATQLTAKMFQHHPHSVIFELVQNAVDAWATQLSFKDTPTKHGVLFQFTHNGRPFNPSDIHSLTYFARSSKEVSANMIGHKGIGFKSNFAVANLVKISTHRHKLCYQKQNFKDGSFTVLFTYETTVSRNMNDTVLEMEISKDHWQILKNQIDILMQSRTLVILASIGKPITTISSGTKQIQVKLLRKNPIGSPGDSYVRSEYSFNGTSYLTVTRKVSDKILCLCLMMHKDVVQQQHFIHAFLPLSEEENELFFDIHAPFEVNQLRDRKDPPKQASQKHIGILIADLMESLHAFNRALCKEIYWRLIPSPSSPSFSTFSTEFQKRGLIFCSSSDVLLPPGNGISIITEKGLHADTPNYVDLSNLPEDMKNQVTRFLMPFVAGHLVPSAAPASAFSEFWGNSSFPRSLLIASSRSIPESQQDLEKARFGLQLDLKRNNPIMEIRDVQLSLAARTRIEKLLENVESNWIALNALRTIIFQCHPDQLTKVMSYTAKGAQTRMTDKRLVGSCCSWIEYFQSKSSIRWVALHNKPNQMFLVSEILYGQVLPEESHIDEFIHMHQHEQQLLALYALLSFTSTHSPSGVIARIRLLKDRFIKFRKKTTRHPEEYLYNMLDVVYKKLLDKLNLVKDEIKESDRALFTTDRLFRCPDHLLKEWFAPSELYWDVYPHATDKRALMQHYEEKLKDLFLTLGLPQSISNSVLIDDWSFVNAIQFYRRLKTENIFEEAHLDRPIFGPNIQKPTQPSSIANSVLHCLDDLLIPVFDHELDPQYHWVHPEFATIWTKSFKEQLQSFLKKKYNITLKLVPFKMDVSSVKRARCKDLTYDNLESLTGELKALSTSYPQLRLLSWKFVPIETSIEWKHSASGLSLFFSVGYDPIGDNVYFVHNKGEDLCNALSGLVTWRRKLRSNPPFPKLMDVGLELALVKSYQEWLKGHPPEKEFKQRLFERLSKFEHGEVPSDSDIASSSLPPESTLRRIDSNVDLLVGSLTSSEAEARISDRGAPAFPPSPPLTSADKPPANPAQDTKTPPASPSNPYGEKSKPIAASSERNPDTPGGIHTTPLIPAKPPKSSPHTGRKPTAKELETNEARGTHAEKAALLHERKELLESEHWKDLELMIRARLKVLPTSDKTAEDLLKEEVYRTAPEEGRLKREYEGDACPFDIVSFRYLPDPSGDTSKPCSWQQVFVEVKATKSNKPKFELSAREREFFDLACDQKGTPYVICLYVSYTDYDSDIAPTAKKPTAEFPSWRPNVRQELCMVPKSYKVSVISPASAKS